MSIAYDYSREPVPALIPGRPRLLLIDGQHVPSVSGRTFETLNPATEQVIATIAEGNAADVDRAVAARAALLRGHGAACAPPSAARSCSGSWT